MSEKEYYLLTDSAWVPENIEIQGEYISNGKIVTGIGTSFTTDLQGGDWLVHPTLNEVSMIRTVETDTRLELYKPFSQDVSSFDPDYQAVLDYATAQGYALPSTGQQTLQNQLMIDRKAAGLWDKDDTFALFAGSNADFALIDWKRLTTYTAFNSPVYTAATGYKLNGASSYISTNYNPSVDGVNYTLNNAGLGYGVGEVGAKGFYIVGCNPSSTIRSRANNNPDIQLNSSFLGFGNVGFQTLGNKYLDRFDAVNVTAEGEGVRTLALASTTVPNQNILIGRVNNIFDDQGLSYIRLGEGYTPTDKANNSSILDTYLASL